MPVNPKYAVAITRALDRLWPHEVWASCAACDGLGVFVSPFAQFECETCGGSGRAIVPNPDTASEDQILQDLIDETRALG